jgi:putative dimethyl sulfoxide reductase chaperone
MVLKIKDKQTNVLKGYNMLLYFTGSMIMFEPNEECFVDFWTKGILKNLPVTSNNPRFIKAASLLRESCEDRSVFSRRMKDDYLMLFSIAGNPLAPPYESIYRRREQLLSDKQNFEVREFYDSYGWKTKFKGQISDDHLGIELLFLTLLIEKYLELDDEICKNEIKSEIRRFINQHILSWVPSWNDQIQEHSKTLGYKGIGTLIYACIEDLYGIMSINTLKYN